MPSKLATGFDVTPDRTEDAVGAGDEPLDRRRRRWDFHCRVETAESVQGCHHPLFESD
jgi:hypothetical protein